MTRRLLILILALASCACNRSRNIPDDELVAITRDIFLSNAFRESLLSGIPMTDSVDIYTPIFEKYGYEPEDFNYTVRNLSKRKSVRFTDIIDEVTASLAREDSLLQKRVALLDTIDRRIDERYRQTVYEDSSRRVVRTGDLEHPDIALPVRPGRYRVEFSALLDSSDRNGSVQYAQHTVDSADRRSNFHYRRYPKGTRKRETVEISLDDPKITELHIILAKLSGRDKERTAASLRIDSLQIVYYPPRKESYDSVRLEALGFDARTFGLLLQNETLYDHGNGEETIGALDPDSSGLAAGRDTLVRR